MKKLFIIAFCAAMIMACGGNKNNKECQEGKCKNQHENCTAKKECSDCEKAECSKDNCSGECESGCDKECSDCEKAECSKDNCSGECESGCKKGACTKDSTAKACIIKINAADFASKIADTSKETWKYLGDKPAIVDFYADWCGPCKMLTPILEEVAKKYSNDIYVYKVNVDDDPSLAEAFKISAIPTLLFIPTDGEPLKTVGMINKGDIEANVAKIMQ